MAGYTDVDIMRLALGAAQQLAGVAADMKRIDHVHTADPKPAADAANAFVALADRMRKSLEADLDFEDSHQAAVSEALRKFDAEYLYGPGPSAETKDAAVWELREELANAGLSYEGMDRA